MMPLVSKHPRLATVAVPGPRRATFTYSLPDGCEPLEPGQRLLVPFGRTKRIGFYLSPATSGGDYEIKPISKVIDATSLFSANLFALCIWMADYYFANPADCLTAALPPALKKITQRVSTPRSVGYRSARTEGWPRYFHSRRFSPEPFDGLRTRAQLLAEGWTAYYLGRAVRDGMLQTVSAAEVPFRLDILTPRDDVDQIALNAQQQIVIDEILPSLKDSKAASRPFLLHGVTGSGKTLVYCHLARDVIQSGRTVLVMAPEIALTGVVLAYFRGFFGERVTVLHSAMTDRERLDSFNGIRQGKYQIVIGPRSALFAPLDKLGLIIVDEEHDSSYKQSDPSPRFHGRDCALMRAKIEKIPIVLGSASPSVESYHHALQGKYGLLKMTERPAGAAMPQVRIIDMKSSRLGGDTPFFSWTLKKELDARLEREEQTILFLNRRGHSPQMKCVTCGYVPSCPNCRVKLTYHRTGRKLACHYCGHTSYGKDRCPSCGDDKFIYRGVGTQKVEEVMPRLFPTASVVRLDSDTATGRRRMRNILRSFAAGERNVLLGTQMVTKGLDLPGVTLVGVLSADLLMDMPDFRASERTFSQLLQVAGRSGRANKPGEVLIQTYYPESEIITQVANQDYESFYNSVIESRRDLNFPPFSRLVNIILSSTDEKKLEQAALLFCGKMKERLVSSGVKATLLGPAPCPMYYLRKKFRRNLMLKTNQVVKLTRMLTEWELDQPRFGMPTAIKVNVDVDPDDMM